MNKKSMTRPKDLEERILALERQGTEGGYRTEEVEELRRVVNTHAGFLSARVVREWLTRLDKLELNSAADLVIPQLPSMEVKPALKENDILMQEVGTNGKEESKAITISGKKDETIDIGAEVTQVCVKDCQKCTFNIKHSVKTIFIQNAHDCEINVVRTGQLRLSNSSNLAIHYSSASAPVMEKCTSIRFHPNADCPSSARRIVDFTPNRSQPNFLVISNE